VGAAVTQALARVLVVTGAGISAESGIPTFRGAGGYWRTHDATKLATMDGFLNDPALVWEWYRERRDAVRRAQPNAAHDAVARLARRSREFLLLTQNVDDLHARATDDGRHLSADHLVQIHGDILVTRCLRCDFSYRNEDDGTPVPICPRCKSMMRPGVVWFGEALGQREVARAERFLRSGPCDVVLVIGTTSSFGYIIDWSLRARGRTGRLIEVNPDETPLSDQADRHIREAAAVALPRVVEELIATRP